MDPVTAIGLGGQAVGFLGKLFGGGNDEDERRRRLSELVGSITRLKSGVLNRAYRYNAGMVQGVRASAARRAAANGTSAEAAILPAESQAISTSDRNISSLTAPYDQAELGAYTRFAERPIEDNAWDIAGKVGKAVTDYGQDAEFQGILQGQGGAPASFAKNIPSAESFQTPGLGSRATGSDWRLKQGLGSSLPPLGGKRRYGL